MELYKIDYLCCIVLFFDFTIKKEYNEYVIRLVIKNMQINSLSEKTYQTNYAQKGYHTYKSCSMCGNTFENTKHDRIYCGTACQKKLSYMKRIGIDKIW